MFSSANFIQHDFTVDFINAINLPTCNTSYSKDNKSKEQRTCKSHPLLKSTCARADVT